MFESTGEWKFINNLFAYYASVGPIVLFDIGANRGNYTQMLLNQGKEDVNIHVFEPTNRCFVELTQRFMGDPKVVLNQKAASDKNNAVKIYYNEEGSQLASLYKRDLKAYFIEMNQFEEIETVRLDDYIKTAQLSHIHFLKLDVEGHELFALNGLGNYLDATFIDFIQFEYGGTYLDSHTSLKGIYDILEKAGFKIAKLLPQGLELHSYENGMEDFQYANYVGISQKITDTDLFQHFCS